MRRAFRDPLFLLTVVVQLVALYWPRGVSTGGLPVDKVVHAGIFGAVAWAGLRAGLPARPLAAVLIGHAVLSELLQHHVLPGRTGDPFDAVADTVGVLVVIAGVSLLTSSRRRRGVCADPG